MNTAICWPDKTLPIRIYCAPGVLTGLEMLAADGLLAMPRTGLGVGGLLLGKRGSDGIEILKTVEISCSHALGPAFVLTADEMKAAGSREADESAGPELVGWYCSKPNPSRTHRPMVLSEHDCALFDALCPEKWQVALLILPDMGKATRAAFGLRVEGDSGNGFLMGAPQELAWQELAAFEEPEPEPAPAVDSPGEPDAPEAVVAVEAIVVEAVEVPVVMPRSGTLFGGQEDPVVALRRPARWPFRLLIAVILLALLAAVAFFTRDYWMPRAQMGLVGSSDGTGLVSVLWNRGELSEQGWATLVIDDGPGPLHTIHLNRAGVRAGWYEYLCRPGRVTATLMAGDLADTVTFAVKVVAPPDYLPASGTSK